MKKAIFTFLLLISLPTFAQKIPFQLLPSGHIVINANVEGKEGNFIFDTGAGINLFFYDFAKDLKQQPTYNFFTAFRATGERMEVLLFKSDEITFGGKKFRDAPYSTFDMKIDGINGLISLQMFSDTDVVIDFDKKELQLVPIDPKTAKKAFDIQLSTYADNSVDIFTYVLLNDKYKIKVMLDSGAGNNSFWLSDNFITLLGLDKKNLEGIEKKSDFNENVVTKMYKGSIASVSNEFAKVDQPKVVFVEGLIYEGKTSINWLGKKIGISLKNKKMYVLD